MSTGGQWGRGGGLVNAAPGEVDDRSRRARQDEAMRCLCEAVSPQPVVKAEKGERVMMAK